MTLRTLCDIARRLEASAPKADQLLFKADGAWRPIDTTTFLRRIGDLARGLRGLGVVPGDRVAILSENRPEWTLADHAILMAGAAGVPIYPTLLPDQIAFILQDSGAKALFVSTPALRARVEAHRSRLADLKHVIGFEPRGALPAGVLALADLEALGERGRAPGSAALPPPGNPENLGASTPADLASVIYTSGTTGRPKGVMLSHGNFAHNVSASCDAIPFESSDVCLSVLPLSHVYERMVEFCYLWRGATIAYAESIESLAACLTEVRPTIVCAVPRLFEKMYQRLLDRSVALPRPRRFLFNWGMATAAAWGASQRRAGGPENPPGPGFWLRARHALAARLVYSAILERFGGRLRFFVSGSAPLSPALAEILGGIGLRIIEGYGMTECAPVIAVNRLDRICIGSVGPPIDGIEVRLAPDGEIEARGASVMSGYWNDPASTRETLRDGWLLTGDIGRFDAHGCLVITDRKKEVLKTSGGKMVAPQPIENLLRADRFIAQAVVLGDRRNFIAALIVPDFEMLRSYALHKGLGIIEPADLLKDPRVLDLFARRVAAINETLARFERVRRFRLLDRDFTAEAGELTPTLKPRRKVIEERYRKAIEDLYAGPPPAVEEEAARAGAGSRA
ncbi:MAG TPA: long-chain fatty acid--CoA ligase [Candidatus Polarisedimenticolia bacterium]|nr:long-chain fatty acid--CoA ligase [Candidatus Polarisedimenticolia bacterium]